MTNHPQPHRAVIFANGRLEYLRAVTPNLQPDDLIIAADGGAMHCQALGLIPQVLIGDFDSLDDDTLQNFAAAGSQIIRHPAHKDHTDLELALLHAYEQGRREILVFAALGARWDQTLANLLLPASQALAGAQIRLLDGPQEVMLLRSGEALTLPGNPGDTVSLIPLGGDAQGITTQGLQYPLEAETLYFGATRGISNVLQDPPARVTLQTGLLLCVVIHTNEPLPAG